LSITVRRVPAGWQWSVAHVDGATIELATLEQMTAHVRSESVSPKNSGNLNYGVTAFRKY